MFLENHERVTEAIRKDLGGPKFRGLVENMTASSIKHCLDNIDEWTKPEVVKHNSIVGKSLVRKEPKGVVLLIAPWNYPINLVFKPLASIVAAGNCAVIKPSEMAPNCAALTEELVKKYLDPRCFRVVQGEVPETTALLRLRWDHILYTGNGAVAKIVMRAASKHLIPVTLELGGKSPVIVDSTAKMDLVVKRIAFGKFLNVGQTCVSPDYILVRNCSLTYILKTSTDTHTYSENEKKQVHKSKAQELVTKFKSLLSKMFKGNPKGSKDYGSIVNSRHAERIRRLVRDTSGEIVREGESDISSSEKFVPPTIVINPAQSDALMREEIFGPVLPIRT